MVDIKNFLFLLLFGAVFIICIKYLRKKYDKSKLKWKKLFLEFWIASFVFFISSLIFGLFEIKFIGGAWQIFAILFLLIIPAIAGWLYYFFGLLPALLFNRFYELLILANIIYWLISKIF